VRAVGLTADGTDVSDEPYGIAVDPRRIPYGTSLYIPTGEGYLDHQRPNDRIFPADDTGGIIRRRTRSTGIIHIDLRFRRHSSAVKFGIKPMTIWIWK
jgi:3D (Asp-Asp-Asp) domain-containing protein